MAQKEEEVVILEAEVVEELEDPNYDFAKPASRKNPIGTRKKDFRDFTAETRQMIIQAAGLGSTPDMAAQFAGIHPTTLDGWLTRGAEALRAIDNGEDVYPVEEDFAEFFREYGRSSANAAIVLLGYLQRLSRNNAQAAIKLLEKIRPDDYGQRQTIDMHGKVAHGHVHVHGRLPEGDTVAGNLPTKDLIRLRENLKKEEAKRLEAGEVIESDDD